MEKMRNLVLILILILQLTIIIVETKDDFNFGDIIAFDRKCGCKTFSHYAIYVGETEMKDEKNEGQDIFHRTGPARLLPRPSLSDCIFDKLNTQDNYRKFNYLDKNERFTIGNKKQITERIKERHHKCGIYLPHKNNCEHLATYVRYGVSISLQPGKDAAKYCQNPSYINTEELVKELGPIYDPDEPCDSSCNEDSSKA